MNLHHGMQYMALAGLLFISACASTPQLSRQDVLQQNDAVSQLDKRLSSAEKKGAEYLAPEGFKQASSYLEQAITAAQGSNNEDANAYAKKGLKALSSVEKDTKTSRKIFVDVIANRDRAIKAGASQSFAKEFKELEDEFRDASKLVEDNKIEKAKKRRPALIKQYGQLELQSVKKGAVHLAKAAIAEAKEKDADDHAPKTFKQAEEELTLALSILEANRNQSKKAGVHTSRAIELARQSVQITELINDFDRRDYSEEDKVLWYQEQLTTIYSPLGKRLVFDQENRALVESMRDDIAALTSLTEKNKKEISKQKKRERETRQRFEYVQSLFTDKEADVYRKREDVLILAQGFYFEPGQSEIKSVNFTLLNKIDKARRKFPGSKLVISGHTDATGNARKNKVLSEKRAANVAKFLVETKGIKASRITVRGYGAEKPVAPNSTKEGRSRNRRIEVLIDNSSR